MREISVAQVTLDKIKMAKIVDGINGKPMKVLRSYQETNLNKTFYKGKLSVKKAFNHMWRTKALLANCGVYGLLWACAGFTNQTRHFVVKGNSI